MHVNSDEFLKIPMICSNTNSINATRCYRKQIKAYLEFGRNITRRHRLIILYKQNCSCSHRCTNISCEKWNIWKWHSNEMLEWNSFHVRLIDMFTVMFICNIYKEDTKNVKKNLVKKTFHFLLDKHLRERPVN